MGFDIASQEAAVGSIQREYLYILAIITLPSGLGSTEPGWNTLKSNVDFYNKDAIWAEKKTDPIKLQWGGQFMYFSGIESGSKNDDITFYDDENGNMYSFLSACQALTGDDNAHAAASDPSQRFTVEVYEVDTLKSKVTKARVLQGFKVVGVKKNKPNKEGSGFAIITANCTWTRALDDHQAKGQAVSTAADDLAKFLSGSYDLTAKPNE